MEFETIKLKRQKGIDNLYNIYAFRGNSQGDETGTNNIAQYHASDGWLSYMFRDIPMHALAIEQESERRRLINDRYVRILKAIGRFGEEYTVTFHVKSNPLFKQPITMPFTDFRIFIPNGKDNG